MEAGGSTAAASRKTAVRPISSTTARQKKKPSDTSPDGAQTRPRVAMPSNMEPTYYIGGGNGNALIEEVMNDLGWKRVRDKTDESVRLRWCEVKGGINYNAFKEGEQMVNRIPNGNLLTNKLGLLNSLQDYSRLSVTCQKRPVKLDFLPETYRLDDPKDRETFVEVFKENDIWICKPTGRNQGKGIFLVRTLDDLNQAIADTDEMNAQNQQQGKPRKPLNRIIQRYIMNPLLLDGRKFDIRCYMLVASTVPLLVLYRKGYIRLSMYEYDNSCENIIAHLTNQFIQKRDPKYAEVKEETAWSMVRFNDYINQNVASAKGIPTDWAFGQLDSTIKQIMVHCVNAVKHKLQCKVGYFDMFGFDFMIDEDMKVWLIEVNVNPCLATNCEALRDAVPGVVRETLHVAIECFEKARRNRPLLPLQSPKEFQIIYDGTSKSGGGRGDMSPSRAVASNIRSTQDKSKPQSPVRRVRSVSPLKETSNGMSRDVVRGKGNNTVLTAVPKPVNLSLDPTSATSTKERRIRRGGEVEAETDPKQADIDRKQQEEVANFNGPVDSKSQQSFVGQSRTDSEASKKVKGEKDAETPYEKEAVEPPADATSPTITAQPVSKKSMSTFAEPKSFRMSSLSSMKSASLKMTTQTGSARDLPGRKKRVLISNDDDDSKPNRGS